MINDGRDKSNPWPDPRSGSMNNRTEPGRMEKIGWGALVLISASTAR